VSGAFLDTNVVVYAFTDDAKSERAQDLLGERCAISIQVLNEFAHVARRKLGFGWPQVRTALADVRTLCPVVAPLNAALHDEALRLAERYGFSIHDALIVSAALATGCDVLYSEDLAHGQTIDGRLRVENPFVDG
jgi:predicted nucleic acid-binding protein